MISVRLRSDKSQACSSQSIRLPSLDTAGADYRRAKHPRPMPMYARFLHLNQIRRLAHANACSLPFSLTSTSAVLPSCYSVVLRHCMRTLAESTPTKPNRPDRSPDNGVVMALNNDQRKATPPTRTSFETDMTRNSGLVKWRWRKVSVSISPTQSYSLPSSLLEDDLLGVLVADPGCHAMLPCESRSHNGSREMSAARHPACASLVFSVYNKGADSGEVGIQKQRFSIVGTRAPVFAMSLSLLFYLLEILELVAHRNRILLVRHRRGAFQLASPYLHRIEISLKLLRDIRRRTHIDIG